MNLNCNKVIILGALTHLDTMAMVSALELELVFRGQ